MSQVVVCGYEAQSLLSNTEGDGYRTITDGVGPAFTTATVHSGAAALRVSGIQGTYYTNADVVDTTSMPTLVLDTIYYWRFWFRKTGNPLSNAVIATTFADDGITQLGRLRLTTTGTLRLSNRLNTQVGSDSSALTTDQWYRIVVVERVNTSGNGRLELWLDGSQVAAADTDVGNAAIRRVQVGSSTANMGASGDPILPHVYYFDALLREQTTLSLTRVDESDSAQGLSRQKFRALTRADETDAAQALSAQKRLALPLASETDAALALAAQKSRSLAVATETETALGLTAQKRVSLGIATEADQALPVTGGELRTVGIAGETDAAQALTAYKVYTLGVATETDEALVMGPSAPVAPSAGGGAFATVIRRPRKPVESRAKPHVFSLTAATEEDEALSLDFEKRYTAEEDLLMLLALVS